LDDGTCCLNLRELLRLHTRKRGHDANSAAAERLDCDALRCGPVVLQVDQIDRETLLRRVGINRSLLKHYEDMKKSLGCGAFGQVHLMKHRISEVLHAVKVIPLPQTELDSRLVRTEVTALMVLDHPNIVRLLDYFEDPECVYIVQQIFSGGHLLESCDGRSRDEAEARRVFVQILGAIAYCHSQGIVHRDLRPENILYETPAPASIVKIVDFGLAAVLSSPRNRMRLSAGTPLYLAPEVLLGRQKPYSSRCDVWSIGVLLCMFLTGQHPFFSQDSGWSGLSVSEKSAVNLSILRQTRVSQTFLHTLPSTAVASLVRKLLMYNPNHRLTASDALKQHWFTAGVPRAQCVSDKLVRSLRAFASLSKFEHAILTITALKSPESASAVRADFDALDTNQSGTLELCELKTVIKDPSLLAVFKAIDLDNNDHITFTEFQAAAATKFEDEAIREAFQFFDRRGDGAIECTELAALFGESNSEEALGWITTQLGLHPGEMLGLDNFRMIVNRAASAEFDGDIASDYSWVSVKSQQRKTSDQIRFRKSETSSL